MQATIKFHPGEVFMTPGAEKAMADAGQDFQFFLERHIVGDWGEADPIDAIANDVATRTGNEILSVYQTLLGVTLWVHTEKAVRKRRTRTIISLQWGR